MSLIELFKLMVFNFYLKLMGC